MDTWRGFVSVLRQRLLPGRGGENANANGIHGAAHVERPLDNGERETRVDMTRRVRRLIDSACKGDPAVVIASFEDVGHDTDIVLSPASLSYYDKLVAAAAASRPSELGSIFSVRRGVTAGAGTGMSSIFGASDTPTVVIRRTSLKRLPRPYSASVMHVAKWVMLLVGLVLLFFHFWGYQDLYKTGSAADVPVVFHDE